GLASQEEGYGLFVPASPACTATMPAVASARVEKLLGRCGNAHASGETSRLAGKSALVSMKASQACSSFRLTNNSTSHSRTSSMHLIQWLNQASAVGWLLGELPGQSIQKIYLRIYIGLR